MRHPSEYSYPVVHADDDHTLFRGSIAVVDRLGGRTVDAAAAVDPDQHRQFLIAGNGRSPKVEGKGILACVDQTAIPGTAVSGVLALHASGREAVSRSDA